MNRRTFIGMILLIGLLLTGCSGDNLDKKLEEAFEGYIGYIKDFVTNSEYDIADRIKYTLAYIDNDEIPELVISTGEAHASGVRICFYDYENKRVADTGENFCQNGDFDSYYERKSCIFDYYFGNGGYFNVCFARIGSGPDYKVTRSRYFTECSELVDNNWKNHYYIDFEEVTKEEYDKAYFEDAPEFVKQDIVTITREDMQGNYQMCCNQYAKSLFYDILKNKR